MASLSAYYIYHTPKYTTHFEGLCFELLLSGPTGRIVDCVFILKFLGSQALTFVSSPTLECVHIWRLEGKPTSHSFRDRSRYRL